MYMYMNLISVYGEVWSNSVILFKAKILGGQ